MRKIIYIIGILLVVSLLLSGCGARKTTVKTDGADVEVDGSEVTVKTEDTETVGSISQSDLDKLKADIEGLETDDLGGLSE
jgi:predicted small secreted protein